MSETIIVQVKNDVDQLFVINTQIIYVFKIACTLARAVYGPLPLFAVVIIVETLKCLVVFELAILNVSHSVQLLLIVNFGYV